MVAENRLEIKNRPIEIDFQDKNWYISIIGARGVVVNMQACQAWDRGFNSLRARKKVLPYFG